jgi:hypothetical protein
MHSSFEHKIARCVFFAIFATVSILDEHFVNFLTKLQLQSYSSSLLPITVNASNINYASVNVPIVVHVCETFFLHPEGRMRIAECV